MSLDGVEEEMKCQSPESRELWYGNERKEEKEAVGNFKNTQNQIRR